MTMTAAEDNHGVFLLYPLNHSSKFASAFRVTVKVNHCDSMLPAVIKNAVQRYLWILLNNRLPNCQGIGR